ncbi:hypothetical protein V6Z12_D06G045900 [Gossypium hirsutum]
MKHNRNQEKENTSLNVQKKGENLDSNIYKQLTNPLNKLCSCHHPLLHFLHDPTLMHDPDEPFWTSMGNNNHWISSLQIQHPHSLLFLLLLSSFSLYEASA